MPPDTRATLRLTLDCNNRCVFCAQQGIEERAGDAGPVAERLSALRQAGADEVTLLGGEPTRAPDLEQTVAAARGAGFRRVGVQSNGHGLTDEVAVQALARAGLTDAHLSIHGPTGAAHDYHTGSEGSFGVAMRALSLLRARDLSVVVTTVLTRSSYRLLGELLQLLSSQGVAGWSLLVPRVAGRAREAFDRIVPRLTLAVPYALHAVDRARRLGTPAFVQGAPLCLLGPYAPVALPEPPPARGYGAPCDGCALRARCPGADPVYLARFGASELSTGNGPVPDPPEPAEIARMFVGVGELALPADPHEPLRRRGPGGPAGLPVVG